MNPDGYFRGDSIPLKLEFKDKNGIAIDISGYTIDFTVRDYTEAENANSISDDTNAKIAIHIISHSDPTNGISKFTILPSDTDIPPGTYFYDIQLTNPSGGKKTVIAGDFIIKADSSRN